MICDVKNAIKNDARKGIKSEKLKESQKDQKKRRTLKEARLIVRNLPFQANESDVKEHFSVHGNVLEVTLLRKGTKLVGCGFVQFDRKLSAAKAIARVSGKPFLGRTVIVDWAVPKNKFVNSHQKDSIDKGEQSTVVCKEEPPDNESEEENSLSSSESVTESESSGESVKQQIKKNIKPVVKRENDIADGQTVFIRNVPFSATNDELKKCVEQFGPVCYALICVDPLTEHSKGTAFVKFKDKESADRCLDSGTSFTLNGTILDPLIALPKESVPRKEKSNQTKDNRNLYLAKEGVIIAGTPAASGVSASDMSKRLALENWKMQKLQNLNMFVSKTRLVVQNLPPTVNDKQLFHIFKKHSPPNSAPKKVKVMRNLKDVDDKGIVKSKGYAFIDFVDHSTALEALRAVNNNPNIFSKSRRPIVSFSIENINAIKTKERRLVKSKKKNDENLETSAPSTYCQQDTSSRIIKSENFSGLNAKFGNRKLLTRSTLKKQAILHNQEIKKEKSSKKKKKSYKKLKKVKDATKVCVKNETDDFSRLVEKYKAKMVEGTVKKKWYE